MRILDYMSVLQCSPLECPMLGSQMRLPGAGSALPLPSPRHFLGAGPGHDIETSIQNWRETFLNKYHEQNREVGAVSLSQSIRICIYIGLLLLLFTFCQTPPS